MSVPRVSGTVLSPTIIGVMATAPETVSRSVRLAEKILRLGEAAFNPERPAQSRSADVRKFNELLSR
jgi:hypothetical protein